MFLDAHSSKYNVSPFTIVKIKVDYKTKQNPPKYPLSANINYKKKIKLFTSPN